MLVLAVTIHNIPEGMAVGVVYAGYLSGNTTITAMGAFGAVFGNRNTEFPGRCNHIHAVMCRGRE